MTTFDDREKAFENRYAHDQDLMFRAEARRNRDVALWAAGLTGRSGPEAEAYAEEILGVAIASGTDGVVRRLVADFAAAGASVSEHQVVTHMEAGLAKAMLDLKTA